MNGGKGKLKNFSNRETLSKRGFSGKRTTNHVLGDPQQDSTFACAEFSHAHKLFEGKFPTGFMFLNQQGNQAIQCSPPHMNRLNKE